jgi:hypothetical protein
MIRDDLIIRHHIMMQVSPSLVYAVLLILVHTRAGANDSKV